MISHRSAHEGALRIETDMRKCQQMRSYEQTMQDGAGEYADAVDALNRAGLPTAFIQTGGMCAALETRLEDGITLLITDADETLSWIREDQAGWGVGLYGDTEHDDLPRAYETTTETTIEALMDVVSRVLTAPPSHS